MSYTPKIKVDQERPLGTSYGDPGVARKDLWLSQRVLLSATDLPPGPTYFWKFLDVPLGSTVEFLDPDTGLPASDIPNPVFTPDLWGSYNIALYLNGTRYYDQITVSVLYDIAGTSLYLGLRPFAFAERVESLRFDLGGGDYNERAATEDVYDIIRKIKDVYDIAIAGAGGAPQNAQYVVITNDATLTDERALAVTAGELALTDNGANSTVELGLAACAAATGTFAYATVTVDTYGRVRNVSAGVPLSSFAPIDSSYIVVGVDGTLTHERELVAGTGIEISDTGAGGSIVVSASAAESAAESLVDSVVSTVSTEGSTRASGDASLTTRLSSEESAGLSRNASLESGMSTNASVTTSTDASLTTRLSDEESTRLSQINSVAAAAGGGGIYDEVITRTGTLGDATWDDIGLVYTMDASKTTSFTVEAVARDAGTINAAYGRYKVACICDGAAAHFVGQASTDTESVMSLIAGDDGDDTGPTLGFEMKASLSGLTIQFEARATLYVDDVTVRLRIGIIKDS